MSTIDDGHEQRAEDDRDVAAARPTAARAGRCPGRLKSFSVITAPPMISGTARPSTASAGPDGVAQHVPEQHPAAREAAHLGADRVVLAQRADQRGAQLAGDVGRPRRCSARAPAGSRTAATATGSGVERRRSRRTGSSSSLTEKTTISAMPIDERRQRGDAPSRRRSPRGRRRRRCCSAAAMPAPPPSTTASTSASAGDGQVDRQRLLDAVGDRDRGEPRRARGRRGARGRAR